jgi:XTP/dITP diphosphohydrolase
VRPRVALATRNEGKIAELRRALASLGAELPSALDLELGAAPAESGLDYEDNALIKAAQAAHASGLVSLADDSGLEVDALGGAPGTYSARFGGNLSDGERIAYLLQRIRQVPHESRGASFVSVLVLADPAGRIVSFRGTCRGTILAGPRGEGGHGYDPIFWSPELGKTFAEASEEEKGSVSHRARATAELLRWAQGSDSWLLSPTSRGQG